VKSKPGWGGYPWTIEIRREIGSLRFGRSLLHCVSGIQELSSLGIRFIATSQGLDTDESNPASKLLMHILAAVAQFERELIRERTIAGIRVAKANGKHVGRPKRVFRRDELVRLREEGQSWPAIASRLCASP
jgi:putative DNA-invertase from lambdoid prophage Rac